jgi:hypothetical protein
MGRGIVDQDKRLGHGGTSFCIGYYLQQPTFLFRLSSPHSYEGADSRPNEEGDIEMKNASDKPENAKEPNIARQEWQAPVLTKETTANTRHVKFNSTVEGGAPTSPVGPVS